MIATQERTVRHGIFQSIRSSIQELHADRVILEDANGAPFLFKTKDAKVWTRIFFRPMRDFSMEEQLQEIKKLWVLMPQDAVLYLFYPELDRRQILKMNGFSDRLSFFEYASTCGEDKEKMGVRICKWIPSSIQTFISPEEGENRCCVRGPSACFLENARLTSQEIGGLAELSLALRRV